MIYYTPPKEEPKIVGESSPAARLGVRNVVKRLQQVTEEEHLLDVLWAFCQKEELVRSKKYVCRCGGLSETFR